MVSKRTMIASLLVLWTASIVTALPSQGPGSAPPENSQEAASQPPAAPSKTEAIAAGYLRTVWAAQREYKKRNARYATTLSELVGKGSFTRRMAQTERGDYRVQFRSDGKEYSVSLVPKQFDAEHRAFFIDETGVVRSEEDRVATSASPEMVKSGR